MTESNIETWNLSKKKSTELENEQKTMIEILPLVLYL